MKARVMYIVNQTTKRKRERQDNLPFRIEAAAPPISNSGDSAIWAFFTAVTVLVRPGPAVTAATPICPANKGMMIQF